MSIRSRTKAKPGPVLLIGFVHDYAVVSRVHKDGALPRNSHESWYIRQDAPISKLDGPLHWRGPGSPFVLRPTSNVARPPNRLRVHMHDHPRALHNARSSRLLLLPPRDDE